MERLPTGDAGGIRIMPEAKKVYTRTTFICSDCGRETTSWIPQSIEQRICVGCREELAGHKLLANQ